MSEHKRSVILYVVSLVITAAIFFVMGLTAPALIGMERTFKTEFVYPSESGALSSNTIVDKPTHQIHGKNSSTTVQKRPSSSNTKKAPSATTSSAAADNIVFPVCLNTATKEELMAIPGIGEKTAAAIINYRNEVGYIFYIEELMNIDGIGEKSVGSGLLI